jgi:hypothetical protein
MDSEVFGDILRALPRIFEINRFTKAFDRYIIYLSKDQLQAYVYFLEKNAGWNEFYMNLFPNQPFPKGYDKYMEYKFKRTKKHHWNVGSLF